MSSWKKSPRAKLSIIAFLTPTDFTYSIYAAYKHLVLLRI